MVTGEPFQIGEWTVLPELNQIQRADEVRHLEPKVMDVLVYLVRHPGQVLAKGRIMQAVWPDTFVGDEVLSRAVSELRKALGDDVRSPAYIETIPKRGYRLITEVGKIGDVGRSHHQIEEELTRVVIGEVCHAQDRLRFLAGAKAAGVTALIALAILVGGILWWAPWQRANSRSTLLEITPLTTDGGIKSGPRFSPDGERVAYAWESSLVGGNGDLWVKALTPGSKPLRLTNDPAGDALPTWSHDGRYIAFTRISFPFTTAAVYVVPSMGGRERKLFDRQGPQLARYPVGVVDWSPVHDTLVFSEFRTEGGPARVIRISVETRQRVKTHQREVLTNPPEGTIGDLLPRFSPDGRRIAFFRVASKVQGKVDVWVKPLDGGEARRLTEQEFDYARFPPTWTADGQSILFLRDVISMPTSHTSQLLRVNVKTREVTAVEGLGQDIGYMDVWGDQLVFTQWMGGPWDVHRVPISPAPSSGSEKVVGSSYDDSDVDVSPDGSRLVFSSSRSGSLDIWMSNADGSEPVQLTTFPERTDTPRWSPDGRQIVFDSLHSGNWDLWLIDPEGEAPRQLTTDPSDERNPTWSRDGKSIYFLSTRTGKQEIFKMASSGGAATQLTKDSGWYALESANGKYVYFDKFGGTGLWRLPSTGNGKEVRVLSDVVQGNWAVGRRGVYFMETAPQDSRLCLFDPMTGESTELYYQKGSVMHTGLTVSRDERWLLFSEQPSPRSELMLAENFR